MELPDDESAQMYRWYRDKVEEINRHGRRLRRLDFFGSLAYVVVLFAFGSLFGYGIQHHGIEQIVLSAIGFVAAVSSYLLGWYRLNRVGRVDLSPVLHRPGGEESGSVDV